jgi:hypothetical protein
LVSQTGFPKQGKAELLINIPSPIILSSAAHTWREDVDKSKSLKDPKDAHCPNEYGEAAHFRRGRGAEVFGVEGGKESDEICGLLSLSKGIDSRRSGESVDARESVEGESVTGTAGA